MDLERGFFLDRPASVDAVREVRVQHVALRALARADGDAFSHLDDGRVVQAFLCRKRWHGPALALLVPNARKREAHHSNECHNWRFWQRGTIG